MKLGSLSRTRYWFILAVVLMNPNTSFCKDLKVSLGYIPSLAESPDKGYFVDFVKAMDEVYTEGSFIISVHPFPRSIQNVVDGLSDFHLPMLNSPYKSKESLEYSFAQRKMGEVCSVIYSRKDTPITREDLKKAMLHKTFPYKIEVVRGTADFYDIPAEDFTQIEYAFKKMLLNRVDALLIMQEEGDHVIRKFKLSDIHRSLFECFDDVIVIQKSPRGYKVGAIVSSLIEKLENSGRLAELRKNIHHPYVDWQPYEVFK